MMSGHENRACRRARLTSALLFTLLAGACNVEPVGTEARGLGNFDGTACGRGVIISSTGDDYRSVNISLMGWDGQLLTPSLISSATSNVGLAAPLSGDVLMPSMIQEGEEAVLIDRTNAVISFVNLSTAEVRAQLSVATGFGANPHDYVSLTETRAYVSRWGHNASAREQSFDAGDDVLIIDPSVPAILGSIDLLNVVAEDPEALPRVDGMTLAGSQLYVVLGSRYANPLLGGFSWIARVHTATDRVQEARPLDGLKGCAGVALSPEGARLLVSCSGLEIGGEDSAREQSGLVLIDVSDGVLGEEQRFLASELADGPLGFSAVFRNDERVIYSSFGEQGGRSDRVFELDLASRESRELLSGAAFSLGGFVCTLGCDVCFVADARSPDAAGSVQRLVAGDNGWLEHWGPHRVDDGIGQPPRYLAAF